jgi:hypothetical protein
MFPLGDAQPHPLMSLELRGHQWTAASACHLTTEPGEEVKA